MDKDEKKYKIISGFSTAIIMLLLLLALIFSYTSAPDVGDIDAGMLVDFGDSKDGFSTNKTATKQEVKQQETEQHEEKPEPEEVEPDAKPTKQVDETQDYEDAPVIEKKEEKKKVEKKKETPPKKVEKPKINTNALFKGSTKVNEGKTKPGGDQGIKTGAKSDVKTGNGKGKGISFDLKGRIPREISKPNYQIQEEGIVVVRIVVSPSGNVVRATAGVKGSTTLDPQLLKIAETAAKETSFSKKNTTQPQTGTITYEFILE